MEVGQLNGINLCRAGRHKLAGILHLGEGENITEVVSAAKEHCQSVKTDTHAAVWRCAVLVSLNQEAELGFDFPRR